MKIGILLLSTTNGRSWKSIKESYLYNIFTKTFLNTIDKKHEYVVYIGIDKYDFILNNTAEQSELTRFSCVFSNTEFKFIVFPSTIEKGYLTKMWNIVHKQAYEEHCDYFYQCGDDIAFHSKQWVNACINKLQENNNIGLTGPINNNNRILTQSFVSRKHMKIFGYYFPEEIKNWGCDDWYNYVYKPNYFYPLADHYCSNNGGEERYHIDNNPNFKLNFNNNLIQLREKANLIAENDKTKIQKYLNK